MLDRNYILNNLDEVRENIKNRGVNLDLDRFLELDKQRSELIQQIDELRQKRNENAQAIKSATSEDRQQYIDAGKNLKDDLSQLEPKLQEVEDEYKELYLQIPNATHPDSPIGATEDDNKELEIIGERKKFTFPLKDHLELAEDLDLLDFKRAAEVTGSRFYYTKNDLTLLEFAVTQFVLNKLVSDYDFTAMGTPDLARLDVIQGTGFNPRGEETQVYTIEGQDLGLIGTAEITVAGYHMNDTIPVDDLPLKYVAVSHCFRNEAGAYGKYSKGLYRVHQFSKVEMFIFCTPEKSEEMHQLLKDIEIDIYTSLGIPFRIIDICTGDLGGPAYRKYDFEAWLYGREGENTEYQGNWGEITSASNCTDYQARRLNIKYKKADGSSDYVHTLNGTAVAFTRVPIALLEHYQQEDGSIMIPEVLQKYMGKDRITKA